MLGDQYSPFLIALDLAGVCEQQPFKSPLLRFVFKRKGFQFLSYALPWKLCVKVQAAFQPLRQDQLRLIRYGGAKLCGNRQAILGVHGIKMRSDKIGIFVHFSPLFPTQAQFIRSPFICQGANIKNNLNNAKNKKSPLRKLKRSGLFPMPISRILFCSRNNYCSPSNEDHSSNAVYPIGGSSRTSLF